MREARKIIDICDCPSSRVVQQSCQNAWQGVAHPVLIYLACLYLIRYLSWVHNGWIWLRDPVHRVQLVLRLIESGLRPRRVGQDQSGIWSMVGFCPSPNGFAAISIAPSGITVDCLFWLGCPRLFCWSRRSCWGGRYMKACSQTVLSSNPQYVLQFLPGPGELRGQWLDCRHHHHPDFDDRWPLFDLYARRVPSSDHPARCNRPSMPQDSQRWRRSCVAPQSVCAARVIIIALR